MDATLYSLLQQGATLITASRFAAHALQNEYAQLARQQGLMVWPTPRILPWSSYLRMACQQHRSEITKPPRLLSESQALALWERIVADSDAGQALLNPASAARNAQRSWQRMHQYRMSLRQVAAYPGEEAQAFAAWADTFVQRTAAQGWLDSARFAGFLFDTQFRPDSALVITGFESLVPEMQQLLDHWQANEVPVHVHRPTVTAPQLTLMTARDADAELKHAAQWARQQVLAGKQRVAVVVPHLSTQAAQVQRRFTDIFAPGQRRLDAVTEALAFRVVATPPLASYPLVHHALLVLQLLQGRADVLLVGQLLRSPFMVGFEQEAAARALLDIHARELRLDDWQAGELSRQAELHHCPQLAAALLAAHQHLRDHQRAALPSEWTERFTQLLRLSGWSRGRVLNSTEQQCFNKLQQLLAELSALDELVGRINLSNAIATLRDACMAESFAPEGQDQIVTVVDADSIAGLQFDALWIMGLHAGDWPPAPEPDAFLPIELQREHGLPEATAATCLRQSRQRLQHLIHTASDVMLSWPQQDDDAELRVSPLLAEWQPTLVNEPSPSSLTPPVVTLAQQLFAARPKLDLLVDTRAPSLLPGTALGGTRIVELQSRCPFRAQAELRLHAKAMPTVSPAVDPTERGRLVHRVLREVWQQLKDLSGLQAADRTILASQVRHIAERIAQQEITGTTRHRQRLAAMEVALCTQWVMRLLDVEAQRTPFRVLRSEESEAFALAGLNIKIQLDRIDELSDGGWLLIDYKTGDSNKVSDWLDAEPGRPRSPQLPLYALAHRRQLAGIAFTVLAPGKAELRGLADSDGIADGIKQYALLKPKYQIPGVTQWDDLLDHWQRVLDQLARQYLAGEASVTPLKGECTYCHLHGLCRVHELDERSDSELTDADSEEASHV